jgi:hypothetical protein
VAEIDRQGGNFSRAEVSGAVDLLDATGKPALSMDTGERFARVVGMDVTKDAVAPAASTAPAAPAAADPAPRAAPEPAEPIAPSPLLPPPPLPPPADPPPAAKPRREHFDDPYSYDDALVRWAARQATQQVISKRERDDYARRQGEHQRRQQQASVDLFSARSAKYRADHPDFDFARISAREDLQVSPAMAASIAADQNGPAIVHYLDKHPAEARRIAAMPDPAMQLYEMGKLGSRAEAGDLAKLIRAAARPASASRPATASRPRELTMEEYAAKKRAARAAARRDHRL